MPISTNYCICRRVTTGVPRRRVGRRCWSSHMATAQVAAGARPGMPALHAAARGVPAAEIPSRGTQLLVDDSSSE